MALQLPPPPPGLDIYQNDGYQVLVSACVTFPLAFVFVVLRLVCRRASGAGLWLDDYLLLVATLGCAIIFGTAIYNSQGIGQHLWAVGYEAQVQHVHMIFVDGFLYSITLGFIKLSILALYWRIFKVSNLRTPIIVVAVIVILWTFGTVISGIFQCTPVDKIWNIILPGTCLNGVSFYYGTAVPNIATDVILLVMPVQAVWKLQVSFVQKILITGMFALGSLVTVISCIRLNYLLHLDLSSPDLIFNMLDAVVWTGVEIATALISACLPTLGPLYRGIRSHSLDPLRQKGSKLAGSSYDSGSGASEGKRSETKTQWSARSRDAVKFSSTKDTANASAVQLTEIELEEGGTSSGEGKMG